MATHLQHHRLLSAGVVHLIAVHTPVGWVGIFLVWAATEAGGQNVMCGGVGSEGGLRRLRTACSCLSCHMQQLASEQAAR